MSFQVEVIADSLSPAGIRLTTFQLRYPRFFHSEFMTHRAISRNASSSRAIPWERMRRWVIDDPATPIHWGSAKAGMQSGEEGADLAAFAREEWLRARDSAIDAADEMATLGIHKSIVNRLIEPFTHINVVATATDWGNFFALRLHRAALPEFQCLAKRMAVAYLESVPRDLRAGRWHLPYVTDGERDCFGLDDCLRLSTARCARVSYKTFDGKIPDPTEDFKLHDRLVKESPPHMSPAEHQGMAVADPDVRSGNFRGFIQYRHTIKGEGVRDFDLAARLLEYEGVDYLI